MQKKIPDLKHIIEGCVKKDITCEKLLYKTFYGYLAGVAFRYLREREMIKELVNDAFLKIFSKIQDFHFEGEEPALTKVFKGWIGKITANMAIDKFRSHKQLLYVDDVSEDSIIEMSVQPADRLSFNDIMALLDHLPPLQQVIFNMHAIEGFSHEEICELVITRQGNRLITDELLPFEIVNQKIWDLESEIFIPAAASRLVTKDQVDRMIASGLEVLSCGANVPFADPEIFFGETGLYVDEKVSVIPDFVANCGMARVFAYFMEREVSMEDHAIFEDISKTIFNALEKTRKQNVTKTQIAQSTFEIALRQLV